MYFVCISQVDLKYTQINLGHMCGFGCFNCIIWYYKEINFNLSLEFDPLIDDFYFI
jgi:hypothetical protein